MDLPIKYFVIHKDSSDGINRITCFYQDFEKANNFFDYYCGHTNCRGKDEVRLVAATFVLGKYNNIIRGELKKTIKTEII